ncbi:hypothetical protein [Methanotorris igneus]|uniref:Uncharacterized protein n=1 Tax=Methanotorris igneus (strain DSM 5666 / JCM 11834 / Kol 5) TaxID=880724 RepID=F6BD24_METIK|nr:hypothetical protein [Methanotorris igneus]AEF96385.1 hypothetical protein Metig_0840 [Methanotorris igneus Kol 5]
MLSFEDYPSIEEIKKEKEILHQEGIKKIEYLKKIRADLDKLRSQYDDEILNNQLSIKIKKLEDELANTIANLAKIDTALKILDATEYILENNIFGDKWGIITSKIKFEELMDIIVDENFDLARIYKKLYDLAGINDKKILKKIENLNQELLDEPKEEHLEKNDSIVDRTKNIKKFLR